MQEYEGKERVNAHFTKSFLGSVSFLNTDDTENEDDYEGESDITDDKSVNTAKENYSEEDKISITNFVIQKGCN